MHITALPVSLYAWPSPPDSLSVNLSIPRKKLWNSGKNCKWRQRQRKNYGYALWTFYSKAFTIFSTDGVVTACKDQLLWVLPNFSPSEGHPSFRGKRTEIWFAGRVHGHCYEGLHMMSTYCDIVSSYVTTAWTQVCEKGLQRVTITIRIPEPKVQRWSERKKFRRGIHWRVSDSHGPRFFRFRPLRGSLDYHLVQIIIHITDMSWNKRLD